MGKKVIVFFFLFVVGCSSNKYMYNADNLIISMERTPCFGRCPVYEFIIKGDGDGTFTGKKNIKRIGTYKYTFSPEQIDTLVKKIQEIKFWDLEDKYEAKVTDLPSTYLTLTMNDRTKKVKDYHGAPQNLRDLENWIDKFITDLEWQKIK